MSGPRWACGYPIEYLKQWANLFKEVHGGLVFGAFGLTKERDIAPALRRNEVVSMWSGPEADPNRRLLGAAIWHGLKVASKHTDFRGQSISVPAGTIVVKAFAATGYGPAHILIRRLLVIAQQRRAGLVIEIFVEDDVARTVMAEAGLTYYGSKVMAGSEIKGLYANTPLGHMTLAIEDMPSIAILEQQFLDDYSLVHIRAELLEWGDRYADHYSSYNKGKSWSAVALRGYQPDDPMFIIDPAEMSKAWKAENADGDFRLGWTTASRHFPETMSVLRAEGWEMRRVRFMRLTTGGALTRHADITDRNAGTADGKNVRFHIPIVTNSKVQFASWDHLGYCTQLHMPEGALCYLDTRRPHACGNEGPGRIHLVVDVVSNEAVRRDLRAVGS